VRWMLRRDLAAEKKDRLRDGKDVDGNAID